MTYLSAPLLPAALSLTTFLATTLPAQSKSFCENVLTLERQGAVPAITLPNTDNTANCTRSLVLGGRTQLHCGWPFDYRPDSATTAFNELVDTLTACIGPDAQMISDQNVNHPDFYDLRIFQIDGFEIGASLKDKSGLRQTYVFLRVSRPK